MSEPTDPRPSWPAAGSRFAAAARPTPPAVPAPRALPAPPVNVTPATYAPPPVTMPPVTMPPVTMPPRYADAHGYPLTEPPTRRRRRHPAVLIGALLALVAAVAVAVLNVDVDDLRSAARSASAAVNPAPVPPPTPEIVALADDAHLSEAGRDLLYAARPQLLDAQAFAGQCDDGHPLVPAAAGGTIGCYRPQDATIVVFAPSDPRLRGFVVGTVAHEVMHAAWDTLSADEQSDLTPVLEAELAALGADDPIREQIAGSVGPHVANRPTELFAYLGTQVWREGGLDGDLEAVYARFVTDRAALVGVTNGVDDLLATMQAGIDAGYSALEATEQVNANDRARLEADLESYDYYRNQYQAKVDEVAAMPADQRAGLRLSWTWWDGTDLPMAPAATTLDRAGQLLARDATELPARESTLTAAEAAAAAERARLDTAVDDYNTLVDLMDPAGTI